MALLPIRSLSLPQLPRPERCAPPHPASPRFDPTSPYFYCSDGQTWRRRDASSTPALSAAQRVGTDLVQAIPLIAAAALGHLLIGDVQLTLTGALLVGGIPGAYLGARLSSRAPDHFIRPVLMVVLPISGLKLLGASDASVLVTAGIAVAVGIVVAARAMRHPSKVPTPPQ